MKRTLLRCSLGSAGSSAGSGGGTSSSDDDGGCSVRAKTTGSLALALGAAALGRRPQR